MRDLVKVSGSIYVTLIDGEPFIVTKLEEPTSEVILSLNEARAYAIDLQKVALATELVQVPEGTPVTLRVLKKYTEEEKDSTRAITQEELTAALRKVAKGG